ncbi:uncharacterized protein [Ptychodera flava]|uniref:uncharacterized protein n=1 Tax=Ptychodera flava TaxID=63121 RepID=UPI003969E2E5
MMLYLLAVLCILSTGTATDHPEAFQVEDGQLYDEKAVVDQKRDSKDSEYGAADKFPDYNVEQPDQLYNAEVKVPQIQKAWQSPEIPHPPRVQQSRSDVDVRQMRFARPTRPPIRQPIEIPNPNVPKPPSFYHPKPPRPRPRPIPRPRPYRPPFFG